MSYSSFTLENVTTEEMKHLIQYVIKNEGESSGGVAKNPCFEASFTHNADTQTLEVQPIWLMDKLTPERFQRMTEHLVHPKPPTVILSSTGETLPTPTPNSCAVYNWAIGFIDNQTGGPLTYSSNDTVHGEFTSELNTIPNGNTYDDQEEDGVWQNASHKDSFVGCEGKAYYLLADGSTQLEIDYAVNTSSSTSGSAGLTGPNAPRYTVTCDVEHQYDAGNVCEYLYVYVTIKQA